MDYSGDSGTRDYPWLDEGLPQNAVSPQTEQLYEHWNDTHELPEDLLKQIPPEEISYAVQGWAGGIMVKAQAFPAAAWGRLEELIDFLDSGWEEFKRKLDSIRLGEVVSKVRDALAAVARAIKATEFALQIGTSGITYQFTFVVDPQEVVANVQVMEP